MRNAFRSTSNPGYSQNMIPVHVDTIEDLDFIEDPLKWVEHIRARSEKVLEEMGELSPIILVLAYEPDMGYVQIVIPMSLLQSEKLRDLILDKLQAFDLHATLSVQSLEIDGKGVALFALESPDDILVRAYEVDMWEGGKKVLGGIFPWSPEKNTAYLPTLIKRSCH